MLTWKIETSAFFLVLVLFILSISVYAQTSPTKSPYKKWIPSKSAHIKNFYLSDKNNGNLHIIYSDGTDITVPKEKGRYSSCSEKSLTQVDFMDVQIAEDRHHIGWLASYMVCAQSYPCEPELVIYQAGHKPEHIKPPYGIMWCFSFLEGGRKVAVKFGFPHGDDGNYVLFDVETGRELDEFYPNIPDWAKLKANPMKGKKTPDWVKQLRENASCP